MNNYDYKKNCYNDVKYYTRDYDLSTKVLWKKQKKAPIKKLEGNMTKINKGYKK